MQPKSFARIEGPTQGLVLRNNYFPGPIELVGTHDNLHASNNPGGIITNLSNRESESDSGVTLTNFTITHRQGTAYRVVLGDVTMELGAGALSFKGRVLTSDRKVLRRPKPRCKPGISGGVEA
jgi:hypothetical protein